MKVYYVLTDAAQLMTPMKALRRPGCLMSYWGLHQNKWPWTVRTWKRHMEKRAKK